jgi:hypothetical protein
MSRLGELASPARQAGPARGHFRICATRWSRFGPDSFAPSCRCALMKAYNRSAADSQPLEAALGLVQAWVTGS